MKAENEMTLTFPSRSANEAFARAAVACFAAQLDPNLEDLNDISIGIFTACIVFPVSILLEGSLTKIERDRIFVIYIIAFFVIFFWAAYEQAGASLTLFASEQTDRVILGWEMPASWIQSFNPFFVVILAAIMPGVWGFLNKRGMEPASPTKQAVGLLLLSLGYLVICFGVKDAQPGVKVSLIWLTGLYFIHTMGEIALSPSDCPW